MVGSILDSANMEKAADVLHRLANKTFLNTVDSSAFALLFPIVSRAMREQAHEAKSKGVQIVGASVNLIADPLLLQPYLKELMPLLQDCLKHPTVSVQHEAAKAFGSLSFGLPATCDEEIMPFLLDTLESSEVNEDVSEVERRGAARGLAEVLVARRDLLQDTLHNIVMQRIASGKTKEARAGGLQLVQALASLAPQVFLPHLTRCMQTVLDALTHESEAVSKQASGAVRVLVYEFGAISPHLLLPRMQESLFFEDELAQGRAMELFFALCEKIAEGMKFGQDFLSMDCLSTWHRHMLLVSVFIARTDAYHDVRRLATLLWKEKLQSGPKAKAEIMPLLLQVLKALQESDSPRRQSSAKACLDDLGSEVSAEDFKAVTAYPGAAGVLFAKDVSDVSMVGEVQAEAEAEAPKQLRSQVLADRVRAELPSVTLPEPLSSYIQTVLVSCCMEYRTRAGAEEALEDELQPLAEKKALQAGSALQAFGLKAVLDKVFDGIEDESEDSMKSKGFADSLVHVEGLRMMYGGGHMLLKDATLDLRRGHRYGVVGRNGAGKTTLMTTVANGGVQGMSSRVKTLHVKPEVLVEASDLNALQFCHRELKDYDVADETLQKALQDVGFPSNMQQKSVNELSGGWRMKLLLASAMMRECDILLLDEPTNHLDKESVEWLSNYLRSLTKTSLMVISHDPGFLNAVCTYIIQYSAQRTLEYYSGNFDEFRKARRISSDAEAEALLLGRATFENDGEEHAGGSADADAGKASGGVTASLLDKTSKISFPIPGPLKGHSSSKPVMELKNVHFAYDEQEGPMILKDISCKVFLTSRIGIVGANGAGKSTLLNLLCGELMPTPSA